MIDYVKTILIGQFEAALCMLDMLICKCPPEHWEDKIANDTFRQVAYHTLFYVDVYCSDGEHGFTLRELHDRGGDERASSAPCAGLSKEETLAYLAICRQKAFDVLAAETAESLQREAGFSWLKAMARGEVHIYNLRHVQHHTGALSAFLRRYFNDPVSWWVRSGWR